MLGCTETITLVRCDGEAYTKEVIHGVSWHGKVGANMDANGMSPTAEITIRIPEKSLGTMFPVEGDRIIRGSVEEEITSIKYLESLNKPFLVKRVGDNRRGFLPHVAVICG